MVQTLRNPNQLEESGTAFLDNLRANVSPQTPEMLDARGNIIDRNLTELDSSTSRGVIAAEVETSRVPLSESDQRLAEGHFESAEDFQRVAENDAILEPVLDGVVQMEKDFETLPGVGESLDSDLPSAERAALLKARMDAELARLGYFDQDGVYHPKTYWELAKDNWKHRKGFWSFVKSLFVDGAKLHWARKYAGSVSFYGQMDEMSEEMKAKVDAQMEKAREPVERVQEWLYIKRQTKMLAAAPLLRAAETFSEVFSKRKFDAVQKIAAGRIPSGMNAQQYLQQANRKEVKEIAKLVKQTEQLPEKEKKKVYRFLHKRGFDIKITAGGILSVEFLRRSVNWFLHPSERTQNSFGAEIAQIIPGKALYDAIKSDHPLSSSEWAKVGLWTTFDAMTFWNPFGWALRVGKVGIFGTKAAIAGQKAQKGAEASASAGAKTAGGKTWERFGAKLNPKNILANVKNGKKISIPKVDPKAFLRSVPAGMQKIFLSKSSAVLGTYLVGSVILDHYAASISKYAYEMGKEEFLTIQQQRAVGMVEERVK